jgi:hypothetical protein
MKSICCTFALLIIGCGRGLPTRVGMIRPEFIPYHAQFALEANQRGINTYGWDEITIDYEDIADPLIIGKCFEGKIGVRKTYWDRSDNPSRELLLYHELGHCLLHRVHKETTRSKFVCSIMASELMDIKIYSIYRTAYLDEMFSLIDCPTF